MSAELGTRRSDALPEPGWKDGYLGRDCRVFWLQITKPLVARRRVGLGQNPGGCTKRFAQLGTLMTDLRMYASKPGQNDESAGIVECSGQSWAYHLAMEYRRG